MDTFQYAVKYLQLGYSVIPVRSDKKGGSLVKWKEYQNRKPTKQEIKKWFDKDNPPGIAIVTGMISGIVVLDLDRHGEHDGKQIAQSMYDWSYEGPMAKTGGGGIHAIYKHPGQTQPNASAINEGIDFRGDGGFIYAPPSPHPSGNQYEWVVAPWETEPEPMPQWLKDEVAEDAARLKEQTGAGSELDQALEYGVEQGERNEMATKLAGRFFARGNTRNEVMMLLAQWNQRNRPPLGKEELQKVIESIEKREQARRGQQIESREETISGIADAFGIPLVDVKRISGEEPMLIFEFEDGGEAKVKAENCISQHMWRKKVGARSGQIPDKISSKGDTSFDDYMQMIFDAAEEIQPGAEAYTIGQIKGWLQIYLENKEPKEEDDGMPETPKKINGNIYIHLGDFRTFINNRYDIKFDPKELVQILSAKGASRETVNVTSNNKRSTRSMWQVPPELLQTKEGVVK